MKILVENIGIGIIATNADIDKFHHISFDKRNQASISYKNANSSKFERPEDNFGVVMVLTS